MVKHFNFSDNHEDDADRERLSIEIPEQIDAAYGMYVWPSAVVLAQFIWYHRCNLLVNKHVLELGAGTSLPGIVAAKCGSPASLTLTDDVYQPWSLKNCELSCAENSIPYNVVKPPYMTNENQNENIVKIMGLTWGHITPALLPNKTGLEATPHSTYPDVILGSDCFYDEKLFEKVLHTVRYLFDGKLSTTTCSPKFYFTYQVRSAKTFIGNLLNLYALNCKQIPLHTFAADECNLAESELPGDHEIELYEISPIV